MCQKIICTFELQYLITSFNSQIVLTNIVIQYYVFSLLNFFENFLSLIYREFYNSHKLNFYNSRGKL